MSERWAGAKSALSTLRKRNYAAVIVGIFASTFTNCFSAA